MKKILFFLITVLISAVVFSQSTGYLRYDTVRVQKVGGNSTLIIENATRNVVGGVLTNIAGGRTEFVMPGSGADSLRFGVEGEDSMNNENNVRYFNANQEDFTIDNIDVMHLNSVRNNSASTIKIGEDNDELGMMLKVYSNEIGDNDSTVIRLHKDEIFVKGLDRVTDSTGLDLMAYNRSSEEWVTIPSDIVGGAGGAGSQTLQQTFDTEVGGSIITKPDSLIFSGSNQLRFISSGTLSPIFINNTSTGGGIFINTVTGVPFTGSMNVSATNTRQVVGTFGATTSGTVANEFGPGHVFTSEYVGGSTATIGENNWQWMNATDRTSKYVIKGDSVAVQTNFLEAQSAGIVRVNNGADTLSTKDYARSIGGGSSTPDTLFSVINLPGGPFTGAAPRAIAVDDSTTGLRSDTALYGLNITYDDDRVIHEVDTTEIATQYDLSVLADTANLLIDSLGAAGISPITTWNNTLYGRRISVSGGSIDTTASGGLLITVPSASGITTLNTLTDATQTFAMGTTAQSNNLGWVSASGVHTLHVPDASGTARGVLTTGTQTINGAKTFTSNLATSSILYSGTGFYTNAVSPNNSNFFVNSAAGIGTTQTAAQYQYLGSTNSRGRIYMGGNSGATLVAGDVYSSVVAGQQSYTEPASGAVVHAGQIWIRPLAGTNGAGTTTDASTLTVEGPLTGITPTGRNDAFKVITGTSYFGGNVELALTSKINIATGTNASVGVSAAMTAGAITISTTAVTASSKIFVSVATAGGTQGFLSVANIVAGTSFDIISSGATDTSTVNWWIIN